ncbi:MAG: ATP-binding protein [Candidatus Methanomethylophilaceae archaeon]|nr:ATP-binding protein [Candidatus Methanomethylophilaceae archaeon]
MEEVLRLQYMSELDEWKDTDVVKVILGVRRAGKSVVMRQYVRRLKDEGVPDSSILFLDFESSDLDRVTNFRDLNEYIAERIPRISRTYVFLDEVQRVDGWERTVNSLMVDYDADVYIAGSNAYLLSSELSTYISGRYVEITVLPFSFKEFLSGHPATPDVDRNARFQQYLRTGGMPLTDPDRGDRYNRMVLEGIYNTVLVKDAATRMKIRDLSGLDSIARFLLDNTGNITNVDSIVRTTRLSKKTVAKYIRTLTEAFLFFKVERYDVVGKRLMDSHEKYYPVDVGLARAVLDRGVADTSRPLENIVFLELVRRGYRVRVGSFRDREVDFTAEKDGRTEYFQVCLTMLEDSTYLRETRSLKAIDDNYPKTVLSLDPIARDLPDGLMHRNVVEWLLDG